LLTEHNADIRALSVSFQMDILFSTFVVGITALLIAGTILNLPGLGRAGLFALMIGSALLTMPEDTVTRSPGLREASIDCRIASYGIPSSTAKNG
jgi:hypothetical protein